MVFEVKKAVLPVLHSLRCGFAGTSGCGGHLAMNQMATLDVLFSWTLLKWLLSGGKMDVPELF